jgi:lipoate-protein ligase B
MNIEIVEYRRALELQRNAVRELQAGGGREVFFFMSHPPTITVGRKGDASHVLAAPGSLESRGIEVVRVERGGDVTFHGPGQLVVYPILDLGARRLPPPAHVWNLEEAMIRALARAGLEAWRNEGWRGVFAGRGPDGSFLKIGAVGVAVARGVCFHGLAMNVTIDPGAFDVIVPCGLRGVRAASMRGCGAYRASVEEAADAVAAELAAIYGDGPSPVNVFPPGGDTRNNEEGI